MIDLDSGALVSKPSLARSPRRHRVALGVVYVVIALLATAAIFFGIYLRRELYIATMPIRFSGDITNGWNWGRRAMQEGVVELYDHLDREQAVYARPPAYGLDYPPIRTWIVSRWASYNAQRFPGVEQWRPDYEFSQPMLVGNDVAEAISAGLVFFIVRRQVLRTASAAGSSTLRQRGKAAIIGLGGFLLLWFNPGVLFDAHAFPQWDMWVMPFFLGAVLAAMSGSFFIAGLLIGVGALMKGQLLWGAPVLMLWPIFSLNYRGAISFISGAAAGVAAITWPWMVRGALAYTVVIFCTATTTAAIIYWRKWGWAHLIVGIIGIVAIGCGMFVGGSLSWWKIGYVYGSSKYIVMYTVGTSNLCTILQERYGYQSPLETVDLPITGAMALKTLLAAVTAACVMLCAAGAAFHYRRRDPRFLASIATPFVLFYTLMPQMHDRYLVWGAAVTALLIGMGAGLTLLHWCVTAIMWTAITTNLCHINPTWWPALTHLVDGAHVGVGWALLLTAAMLLYQAGPWPIQITLKRAQEKSPEKPGFQHEASGTPVELVSSFLCQCALLPTVAFA